MPTTLESLGLDRLTVEERLRLIDLIWDSLPGTVEPGEVPDWHRTEVERRRSVAATRPGVGQPWRDVLAEIEGSK